MAFRVKKSIPLSPDRQGYVYFTSRAYRHLKKEQRTRIDELCMEAGGDNQMALLEFVTTDRSATSICLKHNIASKTTLYRAVKQYYMEFPKRL